jgi:hypothetical protein
MLAYFTVFAILFLFSVFSFENGNGISLYIKEFILFVFLALFIGTRTMGPDLEEYETYYRDIPYLFDYIQNPLNYLSLQIDPIYVLINAFFRDVLFLSFQSFILIFSCSFVFLAFYGIHKYSPLPIISILIYFYYGYFSGFSAIRQVMAAAVFFYSIDFIVKKEFRKFLISTIFILFLHSSSIILFPLYFILNKKIQTKYVLLLISLSVITSLLNLFSFITQLTASFFDSIPILSFVSNKIDTYSNLNEGSSFGGSITIEWLAIIFITTYLRDVLEEDYGKVFNVFYNLFWIGFVIFSIFSSIGDFGRIIIYFKMAYLVLIPMMVGQLAFHKKIIAVFIISLVVGIRIFVSVEADVINNDGVSSRYLPYSTWLVK